MLCPGDGSLSGRVDADSMKPSTPSKLAVLIAVVAISSLLRCQDAGAPTTATPDTAPDLAHILAGGEPRNRAELVALQAHVQDLLERVLPATVNLGGGTGVIVEGNLVLTAGHVIESLPKRCAIVLHDGRRLDGETLGIDRTADTGLVRILTKGEFPTCPMGTLADVQRGDWVLMLGHPSGRKPGRSAPARLGRVLRLPGSMNGMLTSDCTMQAGDSGGPLFDMQGRVIGINSNISNPLTENRHANIDAFRAGWDKLLAGEITGERRLGGGPRQRLGLGAPIEWRGNDAVLGAVAADSAAAKAGLQQGDVVIEVGDKKVEGRRSWFQLLQDRKVGDKVAVVVRRGDATLSLEVALQEVAR